MRFTFVTDLEAAIDQARAAATDGDVVIMGGGDVIGQALEKGIVDEFHVHLAPMVLGGGTPLFGRARASGIANEMSVRRPTLLTSPTSG